MELEKIWVALGTVALILLEVNADSGCLPFQDCDNDLSKKMARLGLGNLLKAEKEKLQGFGNNDSSKKLERFGIGNISKTENEKSQRFSNNDLSKKLERFGIGNILQVGKDIATGLLDNVDKFIPKPDQIFSLGKNIILGLPFKVLFKAINVFCSKVLTAAAVKPKYTPDIKKMQLQLFTKCKRSFVPLQSAEKLTKLADFDIEKKVVIFASGWITEANTTKFAKELGKAYRCRGDTNFILLDAAYFVDTLYSWAAFNTDEVGRQLAKGLYSLSKKVPVENIHLIGHSLGAHIVGAAGRYFTYLSNQTIPRITGLDPANPCFNEGKHLSGLMRGDADFVDVIHSNSGALGKRDPLGDADFYPGGIVVLPPGCAEIKCAHERSWKYYTESVYPGNENNFMATRCTTLYSQRQGDCPTKEVPMGFAVPLNVKGNFMLNVNIAAPFGKHSNKQRSRQHDKCGSC